MEDFTDWQREELEIRSPSATSSASCSSGKRACSISSASTNGWHYAPGMRLLGARHARAGDPRREIAISFDDRRRMEDRIYRLRTGYAWSQAPKSRTVRMITNVEVSPPATVPRAWSARTS